MVLVVVDWGIHEFYISVQFLYIAINFTKQQHERISSRALDIKVKPVGVFIHLHKLVNILQEAMKEIKEWPNVCSQRTTI